MRPPLVTAGIILLAAAASAQEVVFSDGFESGDLIGWTLRAPAQVRRTGQVTCRDADGDAVPCAGTGQDGDLRPGVPWPTPRFTLNGDGTVTDNLTGLLWLADADCFGSRTWEEALADANTLADGACGLTDGSAAGDWHLPNPFEMMSLLRLEHSAPVLSDAAGTAKWTTDGDAFSYVQTGDAYWTSSTFLGGSNFGWYVSMSSGTLGGASKAQSRHVWPVRAPD